MATITETFYRDGNRVPITNEGIITKKSITFAGGTTNAWGDDGGTRDGGVLFTVTGLVKAQVVGVCTVDLVGGATVEVGITGATAIFCSQITDTTLDVGELYVGDTTPASYFIIGEEQAAADNFPIYLLNGNDIILTTTTTNTTTGAVDFYCIWTPISTDGNVTASSL